MPHVSEKIDVFIHSFDGSRLNTIKTSKGSCPLFSVEYYCCSTFKENKGTQEIKRRLTKIRIFSEKVIDFIEGERGGESFVGVRMSSIRGDPLQ